MRLPGQEEKRKKDRHKNTADRHKDKTDRHKDKKDRRKNREAKANPNWGVSVYPRQLEQALS